jgi:hypothetical protein
MQVVMEQFRHWCGLPCVQGAIDNIHISITNPLNFMQRITIILKQEDIAWFFK